MNLDSLDVKKDHDWFLFLQDRFEVLRGRIDDDHYDIMQTFGNIRVNFMEFRRSFFNIYNPSSDDPIGLAFDDLKTCLKITDAPLHAITTCGKISEQILMKIRNLYEVVIASSSATCLSS